MPKGVNSPNVFAELQEVSENFIDTLTRAETVQVGALTLYINTMEQVLQVYQGKRPCNECSGTFGKCF